jgi:hypothetical protein
MKKNNEYIIKHGNIDTCMIRLNDDFRIIEIIDIFNETHLPPYILSSKTKDIYKFDDWFQSRTISNNREGLEKILKKYNVKNTRELLIQNYALSLYDHYWVNPANKSNDWDKINFFQNKFHEDTGDILIGDFTENKAAGISPETTSGGNLPKKWIWDDGETFLLKKGSGIYKQEPFNEIIASKLMGLLGINHVDYTLEWKENEPRCRCKNMLDYGNELVHAWDIVHEININGDKYTQFLERTAKAGIENIQGDIEKMLVVDYIIANTDRHFNNIGFVRNAETLEYYGLAPVYDTGNSLWHESGADEIFESNDVQSKPFKSKHSVQIKKVKDFSWFDSEKIAIAGDVIHDVLKDNKQIGAQREFAIIKKVEHRIKKINSYKK